MNRLLIVVSIFVLSSCAERTVKKYEHLVDRADKIVISNREQHDSMVISTAPILQNLKEILKRNIQPEPPRNFLADGSISLYTAEKRIGMLMISYGEKSFVNFQSDSLNFTFPLPYGIGIFLGELSSEYSR